jgi:hypothetical protein
VFNEHEAGGTIAWRGTAVDGSSRDEPKDIDKNACSLQHPTEGVSNNFMDVVGDPLKEEGRCLCHNKVDHEWRRSGKVSGFGARREDGWKNAKNGGSSASTKQSKLCTECPSKDSDLVRLGRASGQKCWKGCFEELVLCCGIGFDRSLTVSGLIETDKGKGTFSWDKMAIDCLTGSTKLGDTMRDRRLCMVACLLELGRDLMASPKSNESCLACLDSKRLV